MTTAQEQFADVTRRGQEAITGAAATWADGLQKFISAAPVADPRVPSPVEITDTVFNFAEHLLATQREFTKSMLGVAASVTEVRPGTKKA